MGTLVYAYKYTTSHATSSSSSQGGNGNMQQGNFNKKGGTRPQVIFRIKVVLNLKEILQVEIPRNQKTNLEEIYG